MIQGTKYYSLDDAVKAAELRTKGSNNVLYIHSSPSINGVFIDWIVTGLKYNVIPAVTVTNREAVYSPVNDRIDDIKTMQEQLEKILKGA